MSPQDLILMRVQYSEPVTTDEENARRDIETLAGEIERLWAQLAAAQAKIDAVTDERDELRTQVTVLEFDAGELSRAQRRIVRMQAQAARDTL